MPTATGIPDRGEYGDPISGLTAGQIADWVVQKHKAERAGEHYDIRFGTPETGLYSWASRKGLPQPGEKRLAVQQPIHSHGYKDFAGTIREGYGKGEVERHDLGKVLVTKTAPDAIHFSTAHRRFPERYVLIRPKTGKNWLMLNTTKTQPTPYEKIHYKLVPQEKAEKALTNLQPGSSTQAKIDGAAALVQLYKDHFEVLSYRTQKHTGRPIVHTERVFGNRPQLDIPKEYQGQTLRGELYGTKDDKAIPPHELGGLLNSSISKSLTDQEARRIKMKIMLFDVMNKQTGKHQLEVPYEQRMAQTKQIGSILPNDTFHYPEEAKTPEEAKALYERVASGQDPLSAEGVVVHPPTGVPSKIKLRDEADVHIREFFPGAGKYKGSGVGGFRYSHEPEGPIAGEVGTGFSDEDRQKMHQDPEFYLGRIARVSYQNKKPSGALFAPSYMSLHEDYPTKATETAMAKTSVLDSIAAQRVKNYYDLNSYIKEAHSTIKRLLHAKARSDVRDYRAKTDTMRQLLTEKPHEFVVDSEKDGIVGLTHTTGFRLHLPKRTLPTSFIENWRKRNALGSKKSGGV